MKKIMCRRFLLKHTPNVLATIYNASSNTFNWEPIFNVAPTLDMPVILSEDHERQIKPFLWGPLPSWAKDEKISYNLINARFETLVEKPSFREAYINTTAGMSRQSVRMSSKGIYPHHHLY